MLNPKQRVLFEFTQMHQQLSAIKQDKIVPTVEDPVPPRVLRRHLFENPGILTESEKAIPTAQGEEALIVVDSETVEHAKA